MCLARAFFSSSLSPLQCTTCLLLLQHLSSSSRLSLVFFFKSSSSRLRVLLQVFLFFNASNSYFRVFAFVCGVCVLIFRPSPTLTPTDPVPRGLLTLCPGLHIYVCMWGFGCHGGCGCLGYRVCVAFSVPVTLRMRWAGHQGGHRLDHNL